jgi:hypothetical protein
MRASAASSLAALNALVGLFGGNWNLMYFSPCAYQKLDLVESWVGDGFWKTRAVRLNSTALVLFSQSRAVIDGPSRNRRL